MRQGSTQLLTYTFKKVSPIFFQDWTITLKSGDFTLQKHKGDELRIDNASKKLLLVLTSEETAQFENLVLIQLSAKINKATYFDEIYRVPINNSLDPHALKDEYIGPDGKPLIPVPEGCPNIMDNTILESTLDITPMGQGLEVKYPDLMELPWLNGLEFVGNHDSHYYNIPTIDDMNQNDTDTLEAAKQYADDIKPTKLSELENDSGYITADEANLQNYYTKAEVYTKEETEQTILDKGYVTIEDVEGAYLINYYTKTEIDDRNFVEGEPNNKLISLTMAEYSELDKQGLIDDDTYYNITDDGYEFDPEEYYKAVEIDSKLATKLDKSIYNEEMPYKLDITEYDMDQAIIKGMLEEHEYRFDEYDTTIVSNEKLAKKVDRTTYDTQVDAFEADIKANTAKFDGYYTKEQAESAITSKGYITKDVDNLTNYPTDAEVETAITSKGYITKSVNDLTNYTASKELNTKLAAKEDTTAVDEKLKLKVDKADGMGLYPTASVATDNNYTTADKESVATIPDKANRSELKTKVSELENDSQFATASTVTKGDEATLNAAKAYADQAIGEGFVGKGYVDEKLALKADITQLPTLVSQLSNDAKYQTEDDLKNAIAGLGNVFVYVAAVATKADLENIPMEERIIGHVWFVEDEKVGYIWLINSQGVTAFEPFGPELDLSGYMKYIDIVGVTGSNTDKVMSQKAVTDELAKKLNISDKPTKVSDLINDSKFATESQVAAKADQTFVTSELLTKANKDYVDEQLALKAATTYVNQELAKKANTGDIITTTAALTNDAGFLDAAGVKAVKVDKAVDSDTLGGKSAQDIIDMIPEVDLSPYTKTVDIPAIEVNKSKDSAKLGGVVAADYALKTDVSAQIDDATPSETKTYSSKKVEDIVNHPQHKNLSVQVSPRGDGGYQTKETSEDIRKHIDGGGDAQLRHENQIYEYQKYDSSKGAIFYRVDISADFAKETDIIVDYAGNITTETRELDNLSQAEIESLVTGKGYLTESGVKAVKVNNATNADTATNSTQLGGKAASEYALTSAIPTDNKSLKNGAGYLNEAQVQGTKVNNATNADKLGGTLAAEYATKQFVNDAIAAIPMAKGVAF